jgi:biotin carboxyl carrier protein
MKKTLRISFAGKTYDVVAELLDDRPSGFAAPPVGSPAAMATVPAPGPSRPPEVPSAGGIPSPLAGKVVALNAAVGTRVAAGQPVITLEAMKMNTVVSSTCGGTVSAIHVAPGDSVEEGQLLLTLR